MKRIFTAIAALALCIGAAAQEYVYTDAANLPLYGKCTEDTYARYTRLPASFEGVSREPVWYLGRNSAGLYIRFRSDAPSIKVRWTSTFGNSMNHMTDTGTRGIDLYAWTGTEWLFAGAGRPNTQGRTSDVVAVTDMEPQMREYMLYLSLYDGIDSLAVGVPEGYTVQTPALDLPSREKPIVMYGTSIMQGCSASRPGTAYTAILGRMFGREVMNLGFSGNGRLDYEIADLMASVPDPAVYVLDNVPNCSVEEINDRTDHFVDILRAAHPDVPIIMIEDPWFGTANFDTRMQYEVTSKNAAQLAAYHRLLDRGVGNLYYIQCKSLNLQDAFVDGIHFTDRLMARYADVVAPVIRAAIGEAPADDNVVRDWAWAYYFEKDNADVARRPRAVFMGDSITEGWPRRDPDFFTDNNFVCRGISGQTSTQMLARFRRDVIELHPKYVLILAGTNDIACNKGPMTDEMILDNIASMVELAKTNRIKPVLCTVTPSDNFYWAPQLGNQSERIERLNALIRRYASEHRLPLLEYHDLLCAPDGLTPADGLTYDRTHLTLDAYKLLESAVLDLLD